jgi:hypothetical protein
MRATTDKRVDCCLCGEEDNLINMICGTSGTCYKSDRDQYVCKNCCQNCENRNMIFVCSWKIANSQDRAYAKRD